jgi:allophanate hydrolase subunit 2
MRYVTLQKYADMHGKSERQTRRMLQHGRIKGAIKVPVKGIPVWAIPEDAPWPAGDCAVVDNGYILYPPRK